MKKFALLVLMFSLAGCVSLGTTMTPLAATAPPGASDLQSVIVFTRPAMHGKVIEAALYKLTEGKEDFLGFVSYQTKLAVPVKPGTHKFMVINAHMQNADFLTAEVDANKTYHVIVSPRGWPNILFALIPVKQGTAFRYNQEDAATWQKGTFIEKTAKADAWAQENERRVHELRNRVYPAWARQAQSADDQFTLRPGDGM